MKGGVMENSSKTPLEILIDTIGEARAKKEKAEQLEEKLKPSLAAYNLQKGFYAGDQYVLTVGERIETNYSVEKVYKRLGIKGLLKVVKVVVSKLKGQVTLAQMDGLVDGEPKTTKTYSYNKKG
jgi:hypothetical protein